MTTLGLSDRRQPTDGNGGKRAWSVIEKILGTVGAVAVLSLVALLWRAGWLVAEVPVIGERVTKVEGRVVAIESQMTPELAVEFRALVAEQRAFLAEQKRERERGARRPR